MPITVTDRSSTTPTQFSSPAAGKDASGHLVAQNSALTTGARETLPAKERLLTVPWGRLRSVKNATTPQEPRSKAYSIKIFRPAAPQPSSTADKTTAQTSKNNPVPRKTPTTPKEAWRNSYSTRIITPSTPLTPEASAAPQPSSTADKTTAQQKESAEQLATAADNFLEAAKNLHEKRAQHEGQSGIGRYLPGNQHKAAIHDAQQALCQQIQNYPFSQDSQSNKQMLSLWLATTSDLSPADRKAVCDQIFEKLKSSSYDSEILQALCAQSSDPSIRDIRDKYTTIYAKQVLDTTEAQFKEQLTKGSLQDFSGFFTKVDIDSKSTTQLQIERTAIDHLAQDPANAQYKTTLQFVLHVYDAYLNAEDPKKLTQHMGEAIATVFRPIGDQVAKFPSLSADEVKQQAEMIRNNLQTYNRMLDQCLGGKITSMQKQAMQEQAKADTIKNAFRTTVFSRAAVTSGQGFSQVLPLLDDIIKAPQNSSEQQTEFLKTVQLRLTAPSITVARLAYIQSNNSSEQEKRLQIANLTTGCPNDCFPYEFEQHLRQSININDQQVRDYFFPNFSEMGKESRAIAYLKVARETLERGNISDQTRASLEQIVFTNDLYLNRANPTEMTRITNELLKKPFDAEVAQRLVIICNAQCKGGDVSSISKLSNEYIAHYRNEFCDHFRNQLTALMHLPEKQQKNFLENCAGGTVAAVFLANQPIAQLEASQEVIKAMLESGEFKDNAFLKELAAEYQKVIIFKPGDAYIQEHRDKFTQRFREFIQNPENLDFLRSHMVNDFMYKPVNQPMSQREASMEVIQNLLASGKLKGNENLQAVATAYQHAIIFKPGDAYIQKHRDKFTQKFREFIQNPENLSFLQNHIKEIPSIYNINDQPIAQLEASREVIKAMLNSAEFKNNALLKELAAEYQKAIKAKHAVLKARTNAT
ncbi:MAG: hypothetical protein LBJ78_03625 [Puniceicoccales bacterium]|jgi:hypothetical protein|nr:hypothetical protein [Puniceicoccales bacterium]